MNIKCVVTILLFVLSACNEIEYSVKPPEIYELIPYRKGDLWGFCDSNKKIIIPCIYEDAMNYSDDLIAVKHKGKWGFIDKTGKIIVPYKYEFAFCYPNGLALVKNKKFGFVDTTGKEIVPCIYDQIDKDSLKFENYKDILQNGNSIERSQIDLNITFYYGFSENSIPAKYNGKWGFLNNKSELIIPCIYDNAFEFSEGLAVVKRASKYGYIDKAGKVAIPFIYDGASKFLNGYSRIRLNDKIGLIDKNNKIVIPLINDRIECLNNFLYKVHKGRKVKLFTSSGVELFKKYSFIDFICSEDNLVMAFTKDKLLTIDEKGKNIITDIEIKELLMDDDIDMAYKDKTYGWINRFGQTIVPYFIGGNTILSKSFADDCIKNPKGIMDSSGKSAILVNFNKINLSYEFYCGNQINEPDRYIYFWKNSFLEKERIISTTKERKFIFVNDVIFAKINFKGSNGYTNCLGNEIIPCIYDDVSDFYNGFAFVESDLRYKIIDRKGKFVSDKEFEYVKEFSNSGYSLVKYKSKWGFIDKKGTEYWE